MCMAAGMPRHDGRRWWDDDRERVLAFLQTDAFLLFAGGLIVLIAVASALKTIGVW